MGNGGVLRIVNGLGIVFFLDASLLFRRNQRKQVVAIETPEPFFEQSEVLEVVDHIFTKIIS
jgi:hypothetical protein